eukprot:942611-Amphidinium_carterae.2
MGSKETKEISNVQITPSQAFKLLSKKILNEDGNTSASCFIEKLEDVMPALGDCRNGLPRAFHVWYSED